MCKKMDNSSPSLCFGCGLKTECNLANDHTEVHGTTHNLISLFILNSLISRDCHIVGGNRTLVPAIKQMLQSEERID